MNDVILSSEHTVLLLHLRNNAKANIVIKFKIPAPLRRDVIYGRPHKTIKSRTQLCVTF